MCLGGPVSCLISASTGVTALWLAGLIPPGNYPFSWFTWWIGDSIGVMAITPLALIAADTPRRHMRRRVTMIAVPSCLTYAAVIMIFVHARSWEQSAMRTDFERRTTRLADTFRTRCATYVEMAQSIERFYAAAEPVSRQQFRSFVSPSLTRHRGIFAVSHDERVPHARRPEHEQAMRQEGFASYAIHELGPTRELRPAGRREEYFPIHYIEPESRGTMALGFDLASEPVRRAALERARDTGQPAATSPLTLVQETEGQTGVVLYFPLYESTLPKATLAQRRESLRGYISCVFRMQDLFDESLAGMEQEGLELRLYDATAADQPMLMCVRSSAARMHAPPTEQHCPTACGSSAWSEALSFGGRRWLMCATPTAQALAAGRRWQAWTLLAGGMFLACVLGALLLIVTGRTVAIERMVAERTTELSAANASLHREIAQRSRFEAQLSIQAQELTHAKEGADAANQAKSEFLAHMSHEIRTPMTAILGFAEALTEPHLTEDQRRGAIHTIVDNGQHLLSVLDDILDLSKIEAGDMSVECVPCSAVRVVAEVLALR